MAEQYATWRDFMATMTRQRPHGFTPQTWLRELGRRWRQRQAPVLPVHVNDEQKVATVECVICFDDKPPTSFTAGRCQHHVQVCSDCVARLDECPYCRVAWRQPPHIIHILPQPHQPHQPRRQRHRERQQRHQQRQQQQQQPPPPQQQPPPQPRGERLIEVIDVIVNRLLRLRQRVRDMVHVDVGVVQLIGAVNDIVGRVMILMNM